MNVVVVNDVCVHALYERAWAQRAQVNRARKNKLTRAAALVCVLLRTRPHKGAIEEERLLDRRASSASRGSDDIEQRPVTDWTPPARIALCVCVQETSGSIGDLHDLVFL